MGELSSSLSDGSAEGYRRFLDTVPDAMLVVDAAGKISLANIQSERLFGHACSALIGQSLERLVPGLACAVDGDSCLEFIAIRRDGTELPVEVSLARSQTERGLEVTVAIRDVSGRARINAEGKRLAARLASAVESIQDAFALFDHDDRLILCNSGYRRLVGRHLFGPIIGRRYEELLDSWIGDIQFPSEAERANFRAERLARWHERDTRTFDLRTSAGRSLRVSARRTPEGGTVKTIWDLTDEVRLAEELREAREAAEGASRAKSEFVSSMSHELRTPLNAVLGFAQLLQRDRKEPLSQRHRERVEHILRGGEHLLHLIDDVLDLSRIEARIVPIADDTVDVLDVLNELRSSLEPMAARQRLSFEIEACSGRPPLIAADRTRFAQILMNFGSNAIKYNRPGGRVTFVTSTPRPDVVRVTVQDTGIGIPPDKQGKLFQAFQRAGQETGPIQGTGIGLFITKRLAQLMKGDVGFRSVSGDGSAFWVDLPVRESVALSSAPAPLPSEGSGPLVGVDRKLVLYIEDNPANVVFIRDLLGTFENIDLLTASTAETGVEIARAHQPDAVVMDINLPGLSGFDALRALRADPETQKIPVIALTAAATEQDQQQGLLAGFDRYLTKPVKVNEFESALAALLAAS